MIVGATCATDAPTSSTVDTMPTTGVYGSTALANFGASVFTPTPRKMGARTTWKVEYTIPIAFTGTTAPKIVWQMSGVITMQPSVVDVVIRTLRATSPPAMRVQRLDA